MREPSRVNVESAVEMEVTKFRSWEKGDMIINCWHPNELMSLTLSFRASVGFWRGREGHGQGKGRAAGASLVSLWDTLMSEALGEPLGFTRPLTSLDHSVVYLQGNFHLYGLPSHQLFQVLCVSVWERVSVHAGQVSHASLIHEGWGQWGSGGAMENWFLSL